MLAALRSLFEGPPPSTFPKTYISGGSAVLRFMGSFYTLEISDRIVHRGSMDSCKMAARQAGCRVRVDI
jgi:hypothetical protein